METRWRLPVDLIRGPELPRRQPSFTYSRTVTAHEIDVKDRVMTVDGRRSTRSYHFDRHAPQYRDRSAAITAEMLDRCPHISSDNDITGERQVLYRHHHSVHGHQQSRLRRHARDGRSGAPHR